VKVLGTLRFTKKGLSTFLQAASQPHLLSIFFIRLFALNFDVLFPVNSKPGVTNQTQPPDKPYLLKE